MEEKHLGYLFDNNEVDPIEYIKENTNYLKLFNEDDIKTIMADCYNVIYILLNNKKLYISNKDEVMENIDCIHCVDYMTYFAITLDKEIISLNNYNFQKYFGDEKYDKVLVFIFGIVALKNREVKTVLSWSLTSAIIPERFYDVDDIKIEDDIIYVLKDNKWIKLLED